MPHIILLGTLDTKLDEFRFLHSQLCSKQPPPQVTVINCGRSDVQDGIITITQGDLLRKYTEPLSSASLSTLSRGEVIEVMIQCGTQCVRELISFGDVHGIMGAGGSGGTSLISAIMREAAPIGMPKLIVSTVASGETGPLVGETDITMMYSVVDIAGNNALLRTVFGNAAAAMLGMASNYASTKGLLRSDKRFRVGITMFGVTTPGVDAIRKHLEQHHDVEVFVFHATGHGGRAMERLVRSGEIDAIVDVTTTEICDHLMGGNMSAGAERLEAALESGIPTIISLGATDMVNFGPKQSVPERYGERHLYEHNPTITLMRTTPVECEKIGKFIVDKIQHHARNHKSVQVWIPTGGISMMAVPGGAFYDERADDALFMTLKMGLSPIPITVVEDDRDINDPGFAVDIADALMKMAR